MDANALESHPPPKNHLIDCIISRRYALIAQAAIAQKRFGYMHDKRVGT